MRHGMWVKGGRRHFLIALLGASLFWLMPPQAPARAAEPPAEPMDCRVYETKKASITVGLKAGNLLFSVGPEVTFSRQTGIAWDRTVQGLIAKYQELCTRYNAGLATKEEYDARLREIESLYKEAQVLERKLMEETRTRAKSAMDELDRTLVQRKASEAAVTDPMMESLDDLKRRIDKLEPIGRPLVPKQPCPPPAMLGAPGRAC